MSLPDDVTLTDIRRELRRLVALADSAERPKPTKINEPEHPMPGHEWTVLEQDHPYTSRTYAWVIRSVDDSEVCDWVYVSSPDCTNPMEDFTPMTPVDARRLAMALLAAADRAEHLAADVPRLEDRRRTS